MSALGILLSHRSWRGRGKPPWTYALTCHVGLLCWLVCHLCCTAAKGRHEVAFAGSSWQVAFLLAVLGKRWLWSSRGCDNIRHLLWLTQLFSLLWDKCKVLHFLERGSNPVKKQQHWSCATFMRLLCAILFCINIRESTEQFPAVRSLSRTWQTAFYEVLTLLKVHFVSGLEIAAVF